MEPRPQMSKLPPSIAHADVNCADLTSWIIEFESDNADLMAAVKSPPLLTLLRISVYVVAERVIESEPEGVAPDQSNRF
jgi:hypothetical protein